MKKMLIVAAVVLLALIPFGLIAISNIGIDYLNQQKTRAQEVVLQQQLWSMRRAIDSYWQDKEKTPQSLQVGRQWLQARNSRRPVHRIK